MWVNGKEGDQLVGLVGGELGGDDPRGGLLSRLCGGEKGGLCPGP